MKKSQAEILVTAAKSSTQKLDISPLSEKFQQDLLMLMSKFDNDIRRCKTIHEKPDNKMRNPK